MTQTDFVSCGLTRVPHAVDLADGSPAARLFARTVRGQGWAGQHGLHCPPGLTSTPPTLVADIADRRRTFWLVLEPGDASVCYTDPGFDIDAVLTSDLPTLYRMWAGEIELRDAVRAGAIDLTGTRWIVRGLPGWLLLSPIAENVRAARPGVG